MIFVRYNDTDKMLVSRHDAIDWLHSQGLDNTDIRDLATLLYQDFECPDCEAYAEDVEELEGKIADLEHELKLERRR